MPVYKGPSLIIGWSDMDTLADRVRKARSELGLTQQQLAERAGMRQQGIQSIEDGTSKRPRRLVELARALGKTPEWLMDGDVLGDGSRAGQKSADGEAWLLPPPFVKAQLGLGAGPVEVRRMRGDSMDDGSPKGIPDGTLVIVDRSDVDPRQGGIFAVDDGGGDIIRQVELVRDSDPPQIACKPRNPHFEIIRLRLGDGVSIVGRVVGKITPA